MDKQTKNSSEDKATGGNWLAAKSASVLFEVALFTVLLLVFESTPVMDAFNAAVFLVVFVRIWRFFRKLK